PLDLPVDMPSLAAKFRTIAKGDSPSDSEIVENPRAASARLRAVERVAA
ncbi:MAG: 16S rRNA (cytosine(1402)-N(4))-methyltransferase, partial [Actinobacteria bacterium]|nr:16S rRNA (cytosine(1402)-N(4))-methyltransferase [Actinomycetota bacterium]